MKRNPITFIICSVVCLALVSCVSDGGWKKLNSKASAGYLEPVRPGGVEGSPFWNTHSYRFLYAPAFDFAEIEGAVRYRFNIFDSAQTSVATFEAGSPKADLSPVWNDIAIGNVTLVVEGLDKAGNVIGEAGRREFIRDYPFEGPYPEAARDYREAALKGLLYVHNLPCVRAWAQGNGPDMSYPMNSYVCKIIGATVRIECLLAREYEGLRDEALSTAFAAADYLLANCQGEDGPLAGWPPTYGNRPDDIGGYVDGVVLASNGRTMTEEATVIGEAFLDMFDVTADSIWFERSMRVARTYARIQGEDGVWPVKMFYATGEPACNTRMFPTHIMQYLRRIRDQYGVTEFDSVRAKAEEYMNRVVIPAFDMTGQFEDNLCDWTEPYSNLTNITGSLYAAYLLEKKDVTEEEAKNAIDMIRISEDQFVHWDGDPEWDGFKRTVYPCVHEQRAYEEAIDDSNASVAEAFLSLYEYNGDRLALEKSKALLNSITRAQNLVSGRIPTVMAYNGGYDEGIGDIWLNCSWWSAKALMRMAKVLDSENGKRSE